MFERFLEPSLDNLYLKTQKNKIGFEKGKINYFFSEDIELLKFSIVFPAIEFLKQGKRVSIYSYEEGTDFELLILSYLTNENSRNLNNYNYFKKPEIQKKIKEAKNLVQNLKINSSFFLEDIQRYGPADVDVVFIHRLELCGSFKKDVFSDPIKFSSKINKNVNFFATVSKVATKMPSGIKELDNFLDGGFIKKVTYQILGEIGQGKTKHLINLASNILRSKNEKGDFCNFKVLHLSVENRPIDIFSRYYKNFVNIGDDVEDVQEIINKNPLLKNLKIFSLSTTEDIMKKLVEIKKDFVFDVLVIDDQDQIKTDKDSNHDSKFLYNICSSFNCALISSVNIRPNLLKADPSFSYLGPRMHSYMFSFKIIGDRFKLVKNIFDHKMGDEFIIPENCGRITPIRKQTNSFYEKIKEFTENYAELAYGKKGRVGFNFGTKSIKLEF